MNTLAAQKQALEISIDRIYHFISPNNNSSISSQLESICQCMEDLLKETNCKYLCDVSVIIVINSYE